MIVLLLFACRTIAVPVITDGDTLTTKIMTFEGPSGEAWIEYGSDNRTFRSAKVQDVDGVFEVTIPGVPLGTKVTFQAIIDEGTKLTKSANIKKEWPLPSQHPKPVVSGDWRHQLLLIHFQRGGYSFGTVIDEEGDVIWVRTPDIDSDRIIRAHPYEGGVAWLEGDEERANDTSRIAVQSFTGGPISWTRAVRAHHDFYPHDDGFVFLGHQSVERSGFDGASWADDVVRFVPKDGTEDDNIVLHQFADDFSPIAACSHVAADEWVPNEVDWLHANSLVKDGDGWMAMVRYMDTIVRLDHNFETDFLLGGPWSDIDVPVNLSHGHFSDVQGDNIYIFDNQNHQTNQSRAVALTLDRGNMTADLLWTQEPNNPAFVSFLGDVRVLEDGTRLVVSASKGIIDSFDADGNWEGSLTLQTSSIGRIDVVDFPRIPAD